ncbi:MAG TPA: FxsA family protein [Devosiaceae bacterium]
MVRFLLLGIVATPLIEIATFIKVGQLIGLWPTLLAVIASALLGSYVLKTQGLALAGQIRAAMDRGDMPARAVFDAMLVFAAGVLLLVPGFVTDVFGLLLLIPPVRQALYAGLTRNMTVVSTAGPSPTRPRTIELDDDSYREQ